MYVLKKKDSQQNARSDQDYLEEIVLCCPQAIIVLDSEGLVLFASPSASTTLGADPDGLLGRSFYERLHPLDRPDFSAALHSLDGSLGAGRDLFVRFNHENGKWITLQVSAVRMRGRDGEFFTTLYCQDFTERKRREEAMAIHVKAVEQLDQSVVITSREGQIEYVNEAFERMTGYRAEEVIGKNPRLLKSGVQPPEFYKDAWDKILSGESCHGIFINRRKDGSLYHEMKTISPVRDEQGVILHHVATGMDITRHRQAEEKLLASAESFSLSLRGAKDGLWDWDFRTGKLHLSPRWKSMLGYEEEMVSDTVDAWFNLVHAEDLSGLKGRIKVHLEGETPHLEHEHRMLCRDGSYRWVLTRGLAVRDDDGKAYRIAGSQTDIMSRKLIEEQLHHDALHDPLTSLPNRTLFIDRLGQVIARSKREGTNSFAILYLDLDRFKVINDSLGHLAGDQLLIELANRLLRCLRSSDTVSRMGGDEFAVLLDNIPDARTAIKFVDRIEQRIREPFVLKGREVFTTASIGVAMADRIYESPEDLIRDADTAMYEAKGRGKGRYVLFDSTMHARALRMLELETDLRRALSENQLGIHYQPIVSLSEGRVAGFEALVRWRHPKLGFISPSEFIPMAEENGLIDPLGLFILRDACKHLSQLQREFPADPPLTMSVNLSGVQFVKTELIGQIDLTLREFGLDPASLKLEITESTIIEHAEHAEGMMAQLKAQNIHLSIDDFGTGYSSMTNLIQYPIDTVKIDRSFVRKMCQDEESLEIVKATITMARNLRMGVIAEGIETAAQMQILKGLGCQYGQGYYFAKPLEDSASREFLASKPAW